MQNQNKLTFFLIDCSSLKVLDIALTNYRILILTDHGLFYSNETHKAKPRSVLAFHVMWKTAACDIIEVDIYVVTFLFLYICC